MGRNTGMRPAVGRCLWPVEFNACMIVRYLRREVFPTPDSPTNNKTLDSLILDANRSAEKDEDGTT